MHCQAHTIGTVQHTCTVVGKIREMVRAGKLLYSLCFVHDNRPSGNLNGAILVKPIDTSVLDLHGVVDRGHGSGCLRDGVRDIAIF